MTKQTKKPPPMLMVFVPANIYRAIKAKANALGVLPSEVAEGIVIEHVTQSEELERESEERKP